MCTRARFCKASPFLLFLVLGLIFYSHPALAESEDAKNNPWNKAALKLGYFIATTNTSLRFGSGIGIDIDAEQLFGLDTTSTVFRVDGYWRFSRNRRHRLDLGWFSLNRSGDRSIDKEIIIEDPDGNEITIPVNSRVDSFFNLDIFKGLYSYSFFQDNRLDFAGQIGLYIMPIEAGFNASGLFDYDIDEKFTAPLPVIGLRGDIAITPKWFLRSRYEIFYLKIDRFQGNILQIDAALEYLVWKHFGIGLGCDLLHLQVEADGEDYPEIDFRGNIEFGYAGVQLYVKIYF